MVLSKEDKLSNVASLIEKTKRREVKWMAEPYCQLNHITAKAIINGDSVTLALLADHFDESMHYYLQGVRDNKTQQLVDIVSKVNEDSELFSLFIDLWDAAMLTAPNFKGREI